MKKFNITKEDLEKETKVFCFTIQRIIQSLGLAENEKEQFILEFKEFLKKSNLKVGQGEAKPRVYSVFLKDLDNFEEIDKDFYIKIFKIIDKLEIKTFHEEDLFINLLADFHSKKVEEKEKSEANNNSFYYCNIL